MWNPHFTHRSTAEILTFYRDFPTHHPLAHQPRRHSQAPEAEGAKDHGREGEHQQELIALALLGLEAQTWDDEVDGMGWLR